MDKIGGAGFNQPFLPRQGEAPLKGRKTATTGKTGFFGLLGKAETEVETGPAIAAEGPERDAQLEQMLDDVYTSGQDLAANPSPENVIAYKKAVGRFVKQIVSSSVELTETEGRLRKDMKKPRYAVLHVIDDKLEKLGAYVLQNQKDKLEILRRVDELHGLLVDLKH
jgi:uncharacterized protein YaaR (DUF327 family)